MPEKLRPPRTCCGDPVSDLSGRTSRGWVAKVKEGDARQIFDALAFPGAVPESDAACLWTVAGRRTDAPGPEDARARFASDIAAPHGSVIVLPRHPPGGGSYDKVTAKARRKEKCKICTSVV